MKTITPKELKNCCEQNSHLELIDVRTPMEFQEVHLTQAKNIPLDQLNPSEVMAARNGNASEPLYVVCRSGSRGKQACEKFIAAGFNQVINVDGGTLACVEAGLSVKRGQKMMSLERQVRIAAGILILVGVALHYLVHPYLLGLSAFVGAGLVFAGVTDTCAMGMLIAKMPWNQVNSCETSCAK
jgi:rhodanese-related sulfurtransferase